MRRNHVLRVRLTADEYRQIEERRGDKTLSEYIRNLISSDVKNNVHEAAIFNELIAKISRIETEPLFAKLISIESSIKSIAEAEPHHDDSTKHSDTKLREVMEKISYLEQLVGQVRGDTVSILTLIK